MSNEGKRYKYKPIFIIDENQSYELHFSLREDNRYIISKCQILMGGEKQHMRSSVTMSKDLVIKMAKQILEHFGE